MKKLWQAMNPSVVVQRGRTRGPKSLPCSNFFDSSPFSPVKSTALETFLKRLWYGMLSGKRTFSMLCLTTTYIQEANLFFISRKGLSRSWKTDRLSPNEIFFWLLKCKDRKQKQQMSNKVGVVINEAA